MQVTQIKKVLLGHFPDGVLRVVFYFDYEEGYGRQRTHGHGRGVTEFENKTLLDVLLWVETALGFEKEKVITAF